MIVPCFTAGLTGLLSPSQRSGLPIQEEHWSLVKQQMVKYAEALGFHIRKSCLCCFPVALASVLVR